MQNNKQNWLKYLLRTVRVYKTMPQGWSYNRGASSAPRGYAWINNGKPVLSGSYEHALLKIA